MKISPEIINEVRRRADIVEVISEDVALKKSGSNFKGFSPFNQEKTPSFMVSPEKQIFKCFSSGKAGNVFTFLMEYHGLSFFEAVKELANKYGIKLSYSDTTETQEFDKRDEILNALSEASSFFCKQLKTKAGSTVLNYYLKRGFDHNIIERFNLGYAPESWDELSNELVVKGFKIETLFEAGLVNKREKGGYYDRFRGRAIFPIKDFLGRVIGFGARTMKKDSDEPKYVNSPQSIVYDKSNTLYGISEAKNEIRNKNSVILVEGYADVLSLFSQGIENVVASSGTSLTHQQVTVLNRFCKKVFLIYDSDEPGQKATEKALENILASGLDLSIVMLPEGEDPDSFIQSNGKDSFMRKINDALNFVEFKLHRYKAHNLLSSPAEQSKAAGDIVQAIAKIPDTFQHDSYIKILASRLSLTESQLQIIYKQLGNTPQQTETQKNVNEHSTQLLENYEQETNENIYELLPEEKIIIYLMLSGNDNFRLVTEKYHIGQDLLQTKLACKLYELIYEFEQFDDILQEIVSADDIDIRLRNILINLSLQDISPSENWIKFGAEIPELQVEKSILQAKLGLKLKKLDSEINILQQRLAIVKGDEEVETLKKMAIIMQERAKLNYALKEQD